MKLVYRWPSTPPTVNNKNNMKADSVERSYRARQKSNLVGRDRTEGELDKIDDVEQNNGLQLAVAGHLHDGFTQHTEHYQPTSDTLQHPMTNQSGCLK